MNFYLVNITQMLIQLKIAFKYHLIYRDSSNFNCCTILNCHIMPINFEKLLKYCDIMFYIIKSNSNYYRTKCSY